MGAYADSNAVETGDPPSKTVAKSGRQEFAKMGLGVSGERVIWVLNKESVVEVVGHELWFWKTAFDVHGGSFV